MINLLSPFFNHLLNESQFARIKNIIPKEIKKARGAIALLGVSQMVETVRNVRTFSAEAFGFDEVTLLFHGPYVHKAFQSSDGASFHETRPLVAASFSRYATLVRGYYRERLLSYKITSFLF